VLTHGGELLCLQEVRCGGSQAGGHTLSDQIKKKYLTALTFTEHILANVQN